MHMGRTATKKAAQQSIEKRGDNTDLSLVLHTWEKSGGALTPAHADCDFSWLEDHLLCQVLFTVGKSYQSASHGPGRDSPSGHSKPNQPKAPALVSYANFHLKCQIKKQNTAVSRSLFTDRLGLQLQQAITCKSQEKQFPECGHWPVYKQPNRQN